MNTKPSFMCIFVEERLFHIYYWFIDIKLTANSTTTHAEWRLSNTCIFSVKHTTGFWFRNTRQHFSATRGDIWNSQITIRHAKQMALNTPWKGLLFTVWELEHRSRTLPCVDLVWKCTSGNSTFSPLCIQVCLGLTLTAPLILGLQINISE